MALAVSDLLHGPVFEILGVDADFEDVFGRKLTVRVIDKTRGASLKPRNLMEFETFQPALKVRNADLAFEGVEPRDLEKKQVSVNGVQWRVTSVRVDPTGAGAQDGTSLLLVEEVDGE